MLSKLQVVGQRVLPYPVAVYVCPRVDLIGVVGKETRHIRFTEGPFIVSKIVEAEACSEIQAGKYFQVGVYIAQRSQEIAFVLLAVFDQPHRVMPVVHSGSRSSPATVLGM